jgi:hypothetical protein
MGVSTSRCYCCWTVTARWKYFPAFKLSMLAEHMSACRIPTNFNAYLFSMLSSGSVVPLIPISTTRELQNCVESFRRDYGNTISFVNTERSVTHKELVSWCVEGTPLGRDQTNLLTGITSGFRDFAGLYTHTDGRATICEYLGQEDGKRVIAFLANGPSHIQG